MIQENTYYVKESQNSKIRIGDIFCSNSFSTNRISYLENLIQGDAEPCSFLIGNKGGLTSVRLIRVKEKL